MGLFGNLDASEIPDDPFHIDDGTYLTVLTEVKSLQRNSDGQHGMTFKFTITEEDSDFEGNTVQVWRNTYPELTSEDEVTADIRKDLSRLKQTLTQLGVPEEDMDKFHENFESYIGEEYYVSVKNSTDKADPSKKYRNVTYIRLPDVD